MKQRESNDTESDDLEQFCPVVEGPGPGSRVNQGSCDLYQNKNMLWLGISREQRILPVAGEPAKPNMVPSAIVGYIL